MSKQFTCHIQFNGKDSHEKKTFKSATDAVNFIERNRDKIKCVNAQPISVFQLFDLQVLHPVSREDLFYIVHDDPFE